MDYAEVNCVLKVKSNCQSCKMITQEILGSVCGTYSFDINAEEGLATLNGIVEPNYFMKALARTGPHAEAKWMKISHPRATQRYPYEYDMYDNGYNYHGRALPEYSYHHMMEPVFPRYHGSNSYYHMPCPPRPRRRGPFHF